MAFAPTSTTPSRQGELTGGARTRTKAQELLVGASGVVGLLLLWYGLTEAGFGIISQRTVPSPESVVQAAITTRELILGDLWATVTRLLGGLIIGLGAGLGLGLLMSFNRIVNAFFDPLIEGMRPVPIIAMVPFFLLWFGLAETGKVALVALGVFAIIVVSTTEAIKNIPKIYFRAAASLGASRMQIHRRIVIPGLIPGLVGPLRVATALAFTLVVAAEFMGAQAGMGYRILEARRMYNTEVILLGIIMLGVLSGLLDAALRRFTGYLTRWSERQ